MFFASQKQEPKSVGLVGDGDEIDLIEDFEALFEITFSDDEAENILNLDDAHRLICLKLPDDCEKQVKCLTAMAYYRLNRALRDFGRTSPTACVEVPAGLSPRDFQRQLECKSDLKLGF